MAADGSPKPPAVVVKTSVSEWDAEKVEAWLQAKVEHAIAVTRPEGSAAGEAGAETGAPTPKPKPKPMPTDPSKDPPSIWEDGAVAIDVAAALGGLDGAELCALDAGSLGSIIGDYDTLRPIKVQSGILRAIQELETDHT